MPLSEIIGGTLYTDSNFAGTAYANSAGLTALMTSFVLHAKHLFNGTSSTSVTLGLGGKNLTVGSTQAGLVPGGFSAGGLVRIASASDVSNIYMQGVISSYDEVGGAMVVDVKIYGGTGTFSDWLVSYGGHVADLDGTVPLERALGGTAATTDQGALDGMTPAVSKLLDTDDNVVPFGVALYSIADDPWPQWFDGVDGNRATAMAAVAKFDASPDSHLELYDVSDSTTPSLIDQAVAGEITCISKDMVGGYFAVGTKAGVQVWAYKRGSGLVLVGTYFSSFEITSCAVGYSNAAPLSFSGGKIPHIAATLATGVDVVGVVLPNGQSLVQVGTSGQGTACAIAGGRVLYNKNVNAVYSADLASIAADDWDDTAIITDNADANPGFVPDNALAAAGDHIVGAAPEGLTLLRLLDDDTVSAIAVINRTYNTGWRLGTTHGDWLANSKTADRSNAGHTLTETGTVSQSAVAAGADKNGYGAFSAANYLEAIAADINFGDPDDFFLIFGWVRVDAGATGTQTVYEQKDGTGATLHATINWAAATGIKLTPNFTNGGNADTVQTGTVVTDDDVYRLVGFVHDARKGTLLAVVNGLEVGRTATVKNGLGSADEDIRFGINFAGANAGAALVLADWRISSTRISDPVAFLRMVYESEVGGFAASANTLLTGAADAVLDVAVDAGGQVWAMQADNVVELRGLEVITSDATPGAITGATNKGVARRSINGVVAAMLGTNGEAHFQRGAVPLSDNVQRSPSGAGLERMLGKVARTNEVAKFNRSAGMTRGAIASAATLVWDGETAQVATCTLGINANLPTIENAVDGFSYSATFIQDVTGTRTLSYDTDAFNFPGDTPPVLSTAAGAVDKIWFDARQVGDNMEFDFAGSSLDVRHV